MIDSALEAVLRRDRLIVAGALAAIVVLAWAYVLWLAADMDMGGMDMTGFRMIPAGIGIMAPANAPWTAIEFAFVFVMWAVMMVGMMTPSAAPMMLMYARVGRQARRRARCLPRPAGSPPDIFWSGWRFRSPPPWPSGRWSERPCSIPAWQPAATSLRQPC